MEMFQNVMVALWPVMALLIAALFRGVLKAGLSYLEARFGFELEQKYSDEIQLLVDRAIDWTSHKLPRAKGDATKQRAKLDAAVRFVHGELKARGLLERLAEWSEKRLARLIEAQIAERKQRRGELTGQRVAAHGKASGRGVVEPNLA